MSRWTREPWAVAPLVIMGVIYVSGLVRLWHNAGRNQP